MLLGLDTRYRVSDLVEATLLYLPVVLLLTTYQSVEVLYLILASITTTYLFYIYKAKWFSFIVLLLVSVYVLVEYNSSIGLVLLTYIVVASIAIPYTPIRYRSFRDIIPLVLVALYTILFLYILVLSAEKYSSATILSEIIKNPGGLLALYSIGLVYSTSLASRIYREEVEVERIHLLGILSRYSPWRVFHLAVYIISLYLVFKDPIYLIPVLVAYSVKVVVESTVKIGEKSIVVFIIVFYIASMILRAA